MDVVTLLVTKCLELTRTYIMDMRDNRYGIIEASYKQLRERLTNYIFNRVGNHDAAEDICQEAFLRALEYEMITPEIVTNLVYTIARHLIVDRVRHLNCREKVWEQIRRLEKLSSNTTLHEVECQELECIEKKHVARLSPMRPEVYRLSRFDGKSTAEIAVALGISPRTAESHLFIARKEIRKSILSRILT